jgi:hypothetical protein
MLIYAASGERPARHATIVKPAITGKWRKRDIVYHKDSSECAKFNRSKEECRGRDFCKCSARPVRLLTLPLSFPRSCVGMQPGTLLRPALLRGKAPCRAWGVASVLDAGASGESRSHAGDGRCWMQDAEQLFSVSDEDTRKGYPYRSRRCVWFRKGRQCRRPRGLCRGTPCGCPQREC